MFSFFLPEHHWNIMMALQGSTNEQNTGNGILSKYGVIFADMGYTYHTTRNIIQFWISGFEMRETLYESLAKASDQIKQNSRGSNICWQQHQELQEELKANCTKYLNHFQSEYAPDCHYEIQQLSDQCFGDNSCQIDEAKINQLKAKMDVEMIKKFEHSLQ